MNNEQILQLILLVIFIAVLLPVILPIFRVGLGYIGDVFCSSSAQVRSMFANLFFGWLGRAVIPDEMFNLIPLMCRVDVKVLTEVDDDIEETIAEEIVDCFNKFGAGKLDPVFPHASILCSAIVYDVPVDYTIDDYEVDLIKLYDYIINDENFEPGFDEDSSGGKLDYKNYLRFCLRPEYQVNIFTHMDYWETPDVNYCKGSTESGGLIGSDCETDFEGEIIVDWLSEVASSNVRNSCYSIREAALNNWQFDMSLPSAALDLLDDNDMITACLDLCARDCEYASETYMEYEPCYETCSASCTAFKCSRTTGCNNMFSDDFKGLFYPSSGMSSTPTNFNHATVLRRGVFYIRFYDYTDWIQQLGDVEWHWFPECENDIILLGPLKAGIREAVDLNTENKHDYVAVCYKPYIPYFLNHPAEFGEPEEGLVVIT